MKEVQGVQVYIILFRVLKLDMCDSDLALLHNF